MSKTGAGRVLSLIASGTFALVLTLTPQIMGSRAVGGAAHGGLSLAMLGMAGGFVYGFGYRPDHVALRILFSPPVSWVLMAGGLWIAAR